MTYIVSWVRFGGEEGGSEAFPDRESAVTFVREKDAELKRGYFITIEKEDGEMDWKPIICCAMMEDALEYKELIQTDGPSLYAVFHNKSTASMDYCPWCGRKIAFRKEEEEE